MPEVTRKKWDFFISYASEDREGAATPLAHALTERGFNTWLDHKVLSDVSRLNVEIQHGLTECHYGIVVLSPRFLEKDWPMRELDTILAIETIDGRHRLVPLAHNLPEGALREKLPELARRALVSTAHGFDYVCDRILESVVAGVDANRDGIGTNVLPRFAAPAVLKCMNPDCSWRAPDEWPDFLRGVGPQFTLARIRDRWCIACCACNTPVGWITDEEAKEIAAQVRVSGLWAPRPGWRSSPRSSP